MPTFRATLERGNQSRDVEAVVEDGRLSLRSPDGSVGSWALSELQLARALEGVSVTIEGERMLLRVADADAFWEAANTGPFTWWKFWSPVTWSGWWKRRRTWVDHRRDLRRIDALIATAVSNRDRAAEEAASVRRRHDWIKAIEPCDVGIPTAKTEKGLATVPDVTLLETRRREGETVWRAVDFGDVHFTDRRMVFSGNKNVEFRYDKLVAADLRREGLYASVSSRKRDHILAGPAERLSVVLAACRAIAAGEDPTPAVTTELRRKIDRLAATERQLTELRNQRQSSTAPPRPVSPAWVPGLAAALLVLAVGAGADGGAEISSAPPAAVATTAASQPSSIPTAPMPNAPISITSVSTSTTTSTSTSTSTPPTTTTIPPTTTGSAVAVSDVAGEMTVHFFDVGQGDSTLLSGPDFTILIDAGRHDRTDVVPHLRHAGVESIDLLVGTHPDADHIGQLADVLVAYPVTEVWMSGDQHTTLTFERALDAILASDAGYHEARAGEAYDVGSAHVEVVNPDSVGGDLNDGSIVLRVTFGSVSFLFTGDAEARAEADMLGRGHDLAADVLHVGHHGSAASTSQAFLEAVSPVIAVYSAGAGNQYGHPSYEVLDRLADHGVEVYGTDVYGTVVITTDGESISVETTGAATPLPRPTTTTSTTTSVAPERDDATSSCAEWQVDINTASAEELERIKHIGPERAQQILQLRPFSSVDSMERIKGIGPVRLAEIQAEGIACVG